MYRSPPAKIWCGSPHPTWRIAVSKVFSESSTCLSTTCFLPFRVVLLRLLADHRRYWFLDVATKGAIRVRIPEVGRGLLLLVLFLFAAAGPVTHRHPIGTTPTGGTGSAGTSTGD